ncbi:LacI family DNA-binding transcriptional regulator [Microbacterium hibisci]|uniref:LacI family DNA-binding transcriptional regulator n=1 Tax=Microbacterium hibisci TaxID=2036000 RepID=UPI0019429F93|nr:LacI family DNA-binding transcriptional regulator [Microbacterium hibisci]
MRSSVARSDAPAAEAAVEVTLEDVARSAGVSQSTASRVLNGSARRVRPENEERVRTAAARLGYVVDLRAQATAGRRSNAVAIVVGSLRDPAAMQIAAGIHGWADAHDCLVAVSATRLDRERAAELVRTLRGQRPRAIFVVARGAAIAPGVGRELARYAAHGGRPVVVVADAGFDQGRQAVAGFDQGWQAAARALGGDCPILSD